MGKATARRRSDVVEIVWQGRLDGDAVASLIAPIAVVLPGARFVIADAREITGFDSGARQRSIELVDLYRDHGIEQLVTVTTSALLRIAGSAVSLVARMPIHFTETPEQAELFIQVQRYRRSRTRSAP